MGIVFRELRKINHRSEAQRAAIQRFSKVCANFNYTPWLFGGPVRTVVGGAAFAYEWKERQPASDFSVLITVDETGYTDVSFNGTAPADRPRAASPANERALDGLVVTANRVDRDTLAFVVKNNDRASIRLIKDSLPWNTTYALQLFAVPLSGRATVVEGVRPIEDPRAIVIDIPAAAELRGKVDVAVFFPDWRRLAEQGMQLKWSLILTDTNTGRTKQFNGAVEYRAAEKN